MPVHPTSLLAFWAEVVALCCSVPCRYFFSRRRCDKGDDCRFSHAAAAGSELERFEEPCMFYARGRCTEGDFCRFQHIRTEDNRVPAADRRTPSECLDRLQEGLESLSLGQSTGPDGCAPEALGEAESQLQEQLHAECEAQPLCEEFTASGSCREGDDCSKAHGNWCSSCSKYALHPISRLAYLNHLGECGARVRHRTNMDASRAVTCSICLEVVLDNPDKGQRKFGLLDCQHSFCLTCIRQWRSNTDDQVDLESAVRTCPICRCTSHFVTPSNTWPANDEEKAAIRLAYMSRLAKIDCRNFDFGRGICPFGSSCFYRHADRDGTPMAQQVRWYNTADGVRKSLQPTLLSSFLENDRRFFNLRR
ncbi:hypothetical protein WJX73_008791 [Symbiochloris irregularis]|uniref:RING-type E3 ubiquitin transferase n=1 Tax=Symbiochloris irregularis TaxID=706552 RepID=A0AAW1P2L1_9CHLO